jgi:30S ribosome assembly GTPase
MSQMNVVRRCYNCGAILQSEKPGADGYILRKTLEDAPLDRILFCEHCYHENRFNLTPQEAMVSPDFLTMLKDAQASDALIVYVVDLFSFECSFSKAINDIIRSLPLVILANKRDLMPKEANDEDLREYVAHRFRASGLPAQKDDVLLLSLSSLSDTSAAAKLIEEKRRRHDVYIIGATGAGKTLFLSSFLHDFTNKSSRSIVTREYPSTHLRVMQIPLDSSSSIFDTPGTGIANSLLGYGDGALSHLLIPNGVSLVGRDYALEAGSSLWIGGLARLDLLASEKKTLLRAYCSKDVEIKRARPSKRMDEEYKKSLEKEALQPALAHVRSLHDMDIFDLPVTEKGRRDIGVAGLGWFTFEGAGQTFRFYVPKGIGVYGSRAKVK